MHRPRSAVRLHPPHRPVSIGPARRGIVALTALLTAVLLVSGCDPWDKEELLTRPPAVEPLPLTMGIWYAPELRDFKFEDPDVDLRIGPEYPLGPRTVAAFNRVFAGLFRETIDISGPNATAVGQSLSGTLEISSGEASEHRFHYTVRYGLRLRSAAGNVIASWDLVGYGDSPSYAVRDAATALVTGFEKQPDVKRWLDGLGRDRIVVSNTEAGPSTSGLPEGQAGSRIVVLSRHWPNWPAAGLARCVRNALAGTEGASPVVDDKAWRDAVFPWFERERLPERPEDMASILAKPLVRERAAALGARYLAWIEGKTNTVETLGMYVFVYGAMYEEVQTSLSAEVWDLVRLDKLGEVKASASGTNAMVSLIPVSFAYSEHTACRQLARNILALTTGTPLSDVGSTSAESSPPTEADRNLTR